VVAVLARIALAMFTLQLAFARSASEIWLAAAAFGAALALAQPAIQVILLARTPANRRRDVFAWQFIAVNLGAAGGAALGGMLVDLSSQSAMRPVYLVAPILSPLAAALAPVGAVGRTMAAVTGAATVATAIGPILSSTLLGLHLPAGFIALQILFCPAAAAASMRLRGLMLRRVGLAGQASVAPLISAVDLAAER
jgi:hypothetical protein